MKIISVKDYSALSRAAANIIAAQVILKPCCVLGLLPAPAPLAPIRNWSAAVRRASWTSPRSALSTWTNMWA